MLRETNRSVTEIALMYQFNYLQTFSRAFRKQFRLSPLQYRHARYWDMKDYYPSAIVKKFSCKTHVACVNKDAFITPKNKFSYKINFGYTFIINIKDKKINSYPQIYQDCINFIFQKKTNQPLVVFGELKPGIKSDTVIDIFSGYFTTQKRPGVINIPDGYYFCFTSIGTPLELMKFINWAKGHGMHCFGQVLKKVQPLQFLPKPTPRMSIRQNTICPVLIRAVLPCTHKPCRITCRIMYRVVDIYVSQIVLY